MASSQVWRQRVQAWKSSGKRADDFCDGQEFSAGLLRHWAWRLGLTKPREPKKTEKTCARPGTSVPLARVVVARSLARVATVATPLAARGAEIAEIEIDVGNARVRIRAGFDPVSLSAVLDVLEGRANRIEEQLR